MKEVSCFSCSKVTEFSENLGFREDCEFCRTDLHCCKNCTFYEPGSYNECKETSADVVKEKDRANYCEYFIAGSKNGNNMGSKKDDLLSQAESLFKKK